MNPSLIGLLAAIISLVSFIPYIFDILNRKAVPNRATWIIWMVVGVIIAASYYAAGARESAYLPIANAIGLVFMAILVIRYGEGGLARLDVLCLAGAGLGLILWLLTSEPLFALYLTIGIDAIGALPTIKKTYERPESESNRAWLLYLVANSLNLFAITNWTLAIASYPVYVFIVAIIMNALIFWPRTKAGKGRML